MVLIQCSCIHTIGTTYGVLLVFQLQHLRKQQMLLAPSRVIEYMNLYL